MKIETEVRFNGYDARSGRLGPVTQIRFVSGPVAPAELYDSLRDLADAHVEVELTFRRAVQFDTGARYKLTLERVEDE